MLPISPKQDIRNCTQEEILTVINQIHEPKFRAIQISKWLWQKGVSDFDQMTNLSKPFRTYLKSTFTIRTIKEDLLQKSVDGTVKIRFNLYDQKSIESVLIPVPDDNRYTVCVSSQVGCSLTCTFCATGQMKLQRNLDPGEIVDQVRMINDLTNKHYDHSITNIVFMGMGEPLLNYKNVMKSIEKICSPEGLGFSAKRLTISTAGIAKMIKKLAEDRSRVNLALSLHAADDQKRNEIMPINEQNNLHSLMEALRYYYVKTKNKISFEYLALRNFNDTLEDAQNLVRLCKSFPVLVNIIEYNPVEGLPFLKSDSNLIDQFASHLRRNDIMVTIRKSRGKDIDAACGQLANK